MSLPSSVTSVSPVSGELGLSTVSHTLNTGDLVLMDQHQYVMQYCIKKLEVSSCHYYALDPLVNAHNIVFADSSEVCSGIVILGLVLSPVFAQKTGQQTSTAHPCTLD